MRTWSEREPKEVFGIVSQFTKYALVGIIGTGIQTSILIMFVEVYNFQVIVATTMGFICSLLVSFFINFRWTFGRNKLTIYSFVKYLIVSLSGLLLNISILYIMVDLLGIWYIWAHILTLVVVPISNFTLNRMWTF
ncbi:GtrA family protein [Paenibacillus sp. ISL-20]|uniref:GtrA family protein n=1 Tax=Paenibacillus sp. ISL-20 TaxID=2819163 RepID=UPI0020364FC1|nr:GtrA family protein [Paenibacillus sp. ISL-20]